LVYGILLPFVVEDAVTIVKVLLRGGCKTQAITLGEVQLNDGQYLLAANNFFIGVTGHRSAFGWF
jgi:hypothetical protein